MSLSEEAFHCTHIIKSTISHRIAFLCLDPPFFIGVILIMSRSIVIYSILSTDLDRIKMDINCCAHQDH